MGVVYEAFDRDTQLRVALKTLRHANADALARLKREFRAMQDVQHPNLVTLRELVYERGQWFIVMDLVNGGVDFISYVRSQPRPDDAPIEDMARAPTIPVRAVSGVPFDEERLRAALPQLVQALQACHASGMVHRDVKPSNVLVTPDGRVVVLDFGLATEARAEGASHAVVGTPTYMAPEQAASGDVGPEADWYAVGVLLYQALTGRLPFDGAPLSVMLQKQSETPVAPSAVTDHVPKDLEALCVSLLRFHPADRPRGPTILRRLGSATASEGESRSRTLRPPFVGRADELRQLAAAFADSRAGATCVVVEGESGVGKSRLVRRFAEQTQLQERGALVLVGRCYERESVPYKAFDGVVDALARFLAKLPDSDARAVLPSRPLPLVQVFPVLRCVPAIAAQVRDAQAAIEPFELRNRAFAALREMLDRVARRWPLVVVIDDAQWADDDSHLLLADLLREPGAPRLLLVVTARGSGEGLDRTPAVSGAVVSRLSRALGCGVRSIELRPLSQESSRELASLLLSQQSADEFAPSEVAIIAKEAGGHPLFIDILARKSAHAAGGAAGTGPGSNLEDALRVLLSELDPDARAIVEAVSLAEAPLRIRVAAAATAEAATDRPTDAGDRFVRALQRLRVGRLVVSTGARSDDLLEPYHDRVRTAALAGMPGARKSELHRRIAIALETGGDAKPQALAWHWAGAGDSDRAARFSSLAGDRAAEALAFDRAASFYDQALQSAAMAIHEQRALKAKLGDALANAGLGKRAADVLREAAVGAPAAEALDLKRRAAEQLLRAGHFDEGLPALDAVLRSVGVRLPSTPLSAILVLLVVRLWLSLRGLGYRVRDRTQVSAEAMVRVDTCWSAAFGLALSDTVRGAALQAANLLSALRLGESYRIARALVLEACYSSNAGSRTWRQTEALMQSASREVERCGHPHARALGQMGAGVCCYLSGRYTAALEHLERGLLSLREYGRDVSWEIGSSEMFVVNVLGYLGRLRDLRERIGRSLPEMARRGDLHGSINLRVGWANLAWLVGDDIDGAQCEIEEAMAVWSRGSFHLTHFWELIARTNLSLYAGRPQEGHAFLERCWASLWKSMLPRRIQSLRVYSFDARARLAIALAESAGDGAEALLRGAGRDAQRIEREEVPYARARAATLRAGIARVRGDEAACTAHLREALRNYTESDMELNAAVVRAALGSLVGGEQGRQWAAQADNWFTAQTVRRPDRFVAMLAPGMKSGVGVP